MFGIFFGIFGLAGKVTKPEKSEPKSLSVSAEDLLSEADQLLANCPLTAVQRVEWIDASSTPDLPKGSSGKIFFGDTIYRPLDKSR